MSEYPGIEDEVPGEIAAVIEHRPRVPGVPLDEATVQGIRDAAARLDVDAPALR
jgi:hypothetical protein